MLRPFPPRNRAGNKYGYTALFPIRDAANGSTLRLHLNKLGEHKNGSPFCAAPLVHLIRFIIIDQWPYEGYPAKTETLLRPYLVVMCDFDGTEVADLAKALVQHAPGAAYDVWRHCMAFPFADRSELAEAAAADRLAHYLGRGEVGTVLYLSDQLEATVGDILKAIQVQAAFAEFVARHQLADPHRLKKEFFSRWDDLVREPVPHPGSL